MADESGGIPISIDTSCTMDSAPTTSTPTFTDENEVNAILAEFNYPATMAPNFKNPERSIEMVENCIAVIEGDNESSMTFTLKELMSRGGRGRLIQDYKYVQDRIDEVCNALKAAKEQRRHILYQQLDRIEKLKGFREIKAKRKAALAKKEKKAAEKAKAEEAAREHAKQLKAAEELQRQFKSLQVQQQQKQQQHVAENHVQQFMQMLSSNPNLDANMFRLLQQHQQQQQQQEQVNALPAAFQQMLFVAQAHERQRIQQQQQAMAIILQQQQQIQRQQQQQQQLLAQLPPGFDPKMAAILLQQLGRNSGTPAPK